MPPNIDRGKLIARALNRLKRAIASGFYLEALALTDSLISDRIVVIAHYSSGQEIKVRGVKDGLRCLLSLGVVLKDEQLAADTIEWGRVRNAAIHGLSKFEEFSGLSWNRRLRESRVASELGLSLALRWLSEAKWHKL